MRMVELLRCVVAEDEDEDEAVIKSRRSSCSRTKPNTQSLHSLEVYARYCKSATYSSWEVCWIKLVIG